MNAIRILIMKFFLSIVILFVCTQGIQFNTSDYKKVLGMSLNFYEAQRSGKLPSSNRITWRGDSALNDHGNNGEDLVGGYYDASDFVKFGFTMAFSVTLLSWGCITYRKGYEEADQYERALDAIKWATDYFLKCHVGPNILYGQVGNFTADHLYWGRPEEMQMTRPAYKIDREHPGSELAAETGAAFAAASMLFPHSDYSRLLIRQAKDLFEFARTYRGFYHDAIPGAKTYFPSTGFGDELTWCALWLYKATKQSDYLMDAITFYDEFNLKEEVNEFYYNTKSAGVKLLLAEELNTFNTTYPLNTTNYRKAIKDFCDYNIFSRNRTPLGLIYVDKTGTLSHASNIAFICLRASEILQESVIYQNFAREQIAYILGSSGRSFVVGYGENYPRQPHHSASSCPNRPLQCGWDAFNSPNDNPQLLEGALVSGPDRNDNYEDRRDEFLYNDVTLDYNAGFQSVLAGLIEID